MSAPSRTATVTLARHELLWVLEQCGAQDWPYPLAPVAWPADTLDETVLARARTEDALRVRGLLAPGPAAVLLTVGEAVRDRRRQVDLVRRSTATPCAAVALGDAVRGALLVSPDHAAAPVQVCGVPADALAGAVLALLPPLAPSPGPSWPVDVPGADGPPETRRRESERRAVEEVLAGVTAWTHLGIATGPDGVTSAVQRARTAFTWLDGPRGRYRLRHDQGPRPDRERPTASLVPDDAASPGLVVEIEAALGLGSSGRSTA